MYTEKEVEKLLKMQKKVCSDIANANWGSHVGKSVLKSPDVPLVKSTLAPVSDLLPNKDIVVNEGYNKAKNENWEARNVLRHKEQDNYYSGWMDCFEWICKGNKH